ncbi:hypothetical protein [Desulfuromonas sp. CSMB_57]|jgi:hypothetical protein|uniref:hypothetical protein n=1 Tax=Desulfuromonas sp. CSMB_57 TaxID=2807629 RepID=UPI001CD33DFE|nr:hypothetical protein [Desulfuromonas sp. CSMB_57]
MLGGFNHNFRHQGQLFHVQTEDSGRKNPQIVTHLYHGGTILASQRQSYADRLQDPDLRQVVEQLMRAQHKEMLRRLRDGELDRELARCIPAADDSAADTAAASMVVPPPAVPVPPTGQLEELVFAYLAGNDRRYQSR